MSNARNGLPTDESAEDAEFTRLCDQVSLQLRLGGLGVAARAAQELLARWPESTTAHEVAGDVALAQGKVAEARREYQEALKLEPANGDAERKYGLSLVTQTPEERRAALINEVIADPTAHRSSARKPLNAVLNSLLFPGLGQLYNQEHEKGLAFASGGAVVLIILLSILLPYASASITINSPNAHANQKAGAQAVLDAMSGGKWSLVALLIVIFVALWGWGVFDAWRQAHSETEQTLGIR